MKPDDAEIARLRLELAKTRTERDILKKAFMNQVLTTSPAAFPFNAESTLAISSSRSAIALTT